MESGIKRKEVLKKKRIFNLLWDIENLVGYNRRFLLI